MRGTKPGLAALAATACVATGLMAAPIAAADTCDPSVTICQGGDVQTGSASPDYAPPVVAPEEDYPFDGDWFFNSAGGGTALQPVHPSGGGGGGAGGGGHR